MELEVAESQLPEELQLRRSEERTCVELPQLLHRPKETEGWQSWRSGDELLTDSSQILQMLTQKVVAA